MEMEIHRIRSCCFRNLVAAVIDWDIMEMEDRGWGPNHYCYCCHNYQWKVNVLHIAGEESLFTLCENCDKMDYLNSLYLKMFYNYFRRINIPDKYVKHLSEVERNCLFSGECLCDEQPLEEVKENELLSSLCD